MRDEYIKDAQKIIQDPNILINVISRRVKQLRRGSRPLVESLEKLEPPEDHRLLREIIEGEDQLRAHCGPPEQPDKSSLFHHDEARTPAALLLFAGRRHCLPH